MVACPVTGRVPPEPVGRNGVVAGSWGTVGVKVPVEGGIYPPPPPPPVVPPDGGVVAGGAGVVTAGAGVGVVGRVVSEIMFATVTVKGVEVVLLPVASFAVAVSVWMPFETPRVFHVPE